MDKATKDYINKRKIAYVYLLHRMFEGNPALMLKTMRITGVNIDDIKDWDSDFREAVYMTIQEEDNKGVKLPEDIPTIKSIKERVLKRCYQLIDETTDPAKLAMVYKTLSEFETADVKKEKSVLDAINEAISPLNKKKKDGPTMLDKMKSQNRTGEDED